MQALSFSVHIPLVCFGIALPAIILYVEWCYLRTGDMLYRTLAQRWTRIMVALFAVGVITGTILSFEMGLLWPNFTATFGSVFGSALPSRASRSSSRPFSSASTSMAGAGCRPACTSPVASRSSFRASPARSSIAVNGWMNHPSGFRLVGGKTVEVHPVAALFGNSYFWHEESPPVMCRSATRRATSSPAG
jgi:cytochrome d ubiquinol oxidase subunit I